MGSVLRALWLFSWAGNPRAFEEVSPDPACLPALQRTGPRDCSGVHTVTPELYVSGWGVGSGVRTTPRKAPVCSSPSLCLPSLSFPSSNPFQNDVPAPLTCASLTPFGCQLNCPPLRKAFPACPALPTTRLPVIPVTFLQNHSHGFPTTCVRCSGGVFVPLL